MNLYDPGTFLHWYSEAYQAELEGVTIPDIPAPVSWDRKAAYLLWCQRGHDPANIGKPGLPIPKRAPAQAPKPQQAVPLQGELLPPAQPPRWQPPAPNPLGVALRFDATRWV